MNITRCIPNIVNRKTNYNYYKGVNPFIIPQKADSLRRRIKDLKTKSKKSKHKKTTGREKVSLPVQRGKNSPLLIPFLFLPLPSIEEPHIFLPSPSKGEG